MARGKPMVGIVCGSTSDFPAAQEATKALEELGIPYTLDVKSAHRLPEDMRRYARTAERKGYRVIIAVAGGAVDLSGMIAAYTLLPVIGLPVKTSALGGVDSLFSMVQMPEGIPVGVMGIDKGRNAALYAAAIIALSDEQVKRRLERFREELAETTRAEAAKRIKEISRSKA